MKLSSSVITDITEKPSIIEHIDFLCETDSLTYPIADKLRNINNWYNKVVGAILESSYAWKWDDTNYTDRPRGAQTMTAGTSEYTLPVASSGNDQSTFLTLQQVTVLDTASKEVKLETTLIDEATLNNTYATSGLPRYFKLIGKIVKLWPAPAAAKCTLTSGLIIYYTRTPDQFTKADTTQEPGFPSIFHDLLALGPAFEYASVKGLATKNDLYARINEGMKKLQDFYAVRNEALHPHIRTKQTSWN